MHDSLEDSFLQDEDLEGLDTIEAERANIKQYKEQITIDGQQLLERGMATQVVRTYPSLMRQSGINILYIL